MRAVAEKQRADEARRLRRLRAQAAAAARSKGGAPNPPPAAAPAPSEQVCARCRAWVHELRSPYQCLPPSLQAAAPLPAPFSTLPSERVVAGLLQLRRLSTTEFRPDDKHDAAAAASAAAAAAGKGVLRGIPHPEDPRAALLRYDYDKRSPPFRLLTAAGASEDGGVESRVLLHAAPPSSSTAGPRAMVKLITIARYASNARTGLLEQVSEADSLPLRLPRHHPCAALEQVAAAVGPLTDSQQHLLLPRPPSASLLRTGSVAGAMLVRTASAAGRDVGKGLGGRTGSAAGGLLAAAAAGAPPPPLKPAAPAGPAPPASARRPVPSTGSATGPAAVPPLRPAQAAAKAAATPPPGK